MSNDTEHKNPIEETSEEETVAEPLQEHLPWYIFDGNTMAAGFNAVSIARGTVIMSNIFLSASFLYLASKDAGCLDEEEDEVLDDCEGKVFGFKPASLVANIAVIAGVLSALFLPIIGAMIDYTPHRKAVGMASALGIMAIQAVQIGTVSATWFPMMILQALAGFLFEIQVVSGFSYLPAIARVVGEETMTKRELYY